MNIRIKRASRRPFAAVVSAVLMASVLALVSSPASGGALVTEKRTSGVDRYATSAATATLAYPSGTNNVVLVSGANHADGLSAAALAGAVGGPVLLTAPGDMMGSTGNAIGTLDAGVAGKMSVHIVGGTNAVSAAQETYLTGLGYTVSRTSGADRYATAAAVADKVATLTTFGTTPYNSRRTAILVTGNDFADGLAAGGIAHNKKMPILLTDGNTLSAETKAVLDNAVYNIRRVIIVGGTAAVSEAVATEVAAIKNTVNIQVTRVSGANRYATAVEVAKFYTKATDLDGLNQTGVTEIVLASGENFADALSGSSYAGAANTRAMVLTAGSALSSETNTYLSSLDLNVTALRVLGGTSAVSAATMTAADAAVTYSRPTATMVVTEGSATVKVTFSEKMAGGTAPALGVEDGNNGDCSDNDDTNATVGTGIHTAANFKKNNAVMQDMEATGAGCNAHAADEVLTSLDATGKVLTITFASALAAGDVVTLVGGANFATASGARQLAAISATVADDTTKPTVTGKVVQGSQTAIITFSEAVKNFAAEDADIDCVDASAANDNASSVTQIAGTNAWQVVCQNEEDIETSLDHIHIKAAGFTDLGGNAMAADAKIYATTDAVAPPATPVPLTSTAPTQCPVTPNRGAGDITSAAVKGGAADGGIGNEWSFQLMDNNAAPAIMLFDELGKKFVIGADLNASAVTQPTSSTVVNALMADSRFTALFTATVGVLGNAETAVTGTCAGATTVYNATVQFSEGVINAAGMNQANYDTDADGNGTADGAVTEASVAAGSDTSTGKVLLTFTTNAANELMVAGTSQLQVGNGVTDIFGNAPAATQKIVMQ